MSKCGKGCMPECEYFTTGGCISPFNCPYKIETGYINTATSIPTYMEQYNGMSDDVVKRLKAENADLHERLKEAEHRAEVAEKDLEKHKRALRNAVWGLMTEGVYGFVAESEAEFEKEIQNELEQAEREIEEEKGE